MQDVTGIILRDFVLFFNVLFLLIHDFYFEVILFLWVFCLCQMYPSYDLIVFSCVLLPR